MRMIKVENESKKIKRLGNFTLDEISEICQKHNCQKGCPFYEEVDDNYVGCFVDNFKNALVSYKQKILNTEIEVRYD